jgi:hypothetical protein
MSKAEIIKSFCIVSSAIGSLELLKWSFPQHKLEVFLFLSALHGALYMIKSYRFMRALILLGCLKDTLERLHNNMEKWQCECGHKKMGFAVSTIECIKDVVVKDVLKDVVEEDEDGE